MSTTFVYLDESYDNDLFVYSGLCIRDGEWNAVFAEVRDFRRVLRSNHGIYMKKELHASKFAKGRGRASSRTLGKWERRKVFHMTMDSIEQLSTYRNVTILNTVCRPRDKSQTLGYLLNKVQRMVVEEKGWAVLLFDEGNEVAITRAVRRLRVYNPVGSRYGTWTGGQASRNLPIDRIIEDPFFKQSQSSYFLQLADFVAYAVLQWARSVIDIVNWRLLPQRAQQPPQSTFPLATAFRRLNNVLLKAASQQDPFSLGITWNPRLQ